MPYFVSVTVGENEQAWLLGEDYSFCERAYGWEDAGRDVQRFSDHTFHITDDTKPT